MDRRQTSQTMTEDDIHALVDGQATPARLAALQAQLMQEPAAQTIVLKWQQQREALKNLYPSNLTEPLAASLMAVAQQTAVAEQEVRHWRHWGGMAAGVMLAFGIGWLSNTAWHGELPGQSPSATLAKALAVQDFARQASYAHVVYSPEIRHPVEVAAAEQVHLVQWLSKRVGKPLKVPNLSALGYELVGGRLLPGEAGARAQFMFQNTTGTRITLYLGAVDKASNGANTRETGFHFTTDGPIPSFYWIDQGFGYALAGPVAQTELKKLAESVYLQL